MPITDLLERNSKLYGDEAALVEINPEIREEQRVTWREYELIQPTSTAYYRRQITWSVFDEKANRVANMLMERGIKKGQKCAILLMNCLEWLPIYFGILKSGAVAVPLNFRFDSEEIDYCLKASDSDVLFYGPEFIGRIEDIAQKLKKEMLLYYVGDQCPSYAEDYFRQVSNASSVAPKVLLEDSDDAAIYFSSGTTGFPKAILHIHTALMQSAKMEAMHHETNHEDCFLCIPPLYHTGAKMHWFGSLFTGSRAVLLKGNSPESIFRAVSEEHCTIVWLLVPWAQDILAALDSGKLKLEDYKLSQWRLMHIGAQPIPPSLVRHWLEYFPHHKYDTNYGLSESTGPGCVHLGMDHVDKVGAIGVPGYGWKTKIVDEEGKPVEKGEIGELCVKGPGVMVCYYKNPEATAEILKDGWLFTGDMARQDEDGFIFLVDRKKDVIISGGENLYPVQIENFLMKNDKIHDAAVIGLSDPRLGEIAAAIIQVKEGMTLSEDEVEAFCVDLPRYKRPRKIIFDTVLRNPTGKIDKPKLRLKYCGDHLVEKQNRA
ncbi:class I adenylate-forming enzyme family protein [Butyrivibrio sp. INlla14]|uniref:class I adenylate-forming enzyme family protein n=1 Tax=Butyrivibrio sp. INlla14 TaxID=1520808 RepID=UPI000876102A|nr:class I adenylate-forming enzyme family protein [Butyrivibrio sp. INlla14]SCY70778.1 Acyl-CoA synthetase (AMP-forming)/AMP-acid ligase II [Butyrivibrio sp. INlla14]